MTDDGRRRQPPRDDLDILAAALDDAEEITIKDGSPRDDAPPEGSGGDDALNRELAAFERNDIGNARRLRRRFGADLVYVLGTGWCVWDGRRFAAELGETEAEKRAHWTVQLIASKEVKALRDLGPPGPSDQEAMEPNQQVKDALRAQRIKAWEDGLKAMKAFSVASGNAGKVAGMLAMAQPYRTRDANAMDADLWLLNVGNGTLVLDRRVEAAKARAALQALRAEGCSDEPPEAKAPPWELREHRRDDLLTRLAGADYRPEARCPRFIAFIDRILPDPEVRRFVQRFLGYCLLGLTDEQVFAIFWGDGKNGKSRLVGIIREVIGDYAATIAPGVFLEKRNDDPDKPRPSLAKLPSKRIVFMSEPKRNAALDEGLVKELTGGEPVEVRKLNQDPFEFVPQFTPVMSANHRPDIRGLDQGIWRRILLVPFTVTIPVEERDPDLLNKLRPEKDGILNWLLDGLWDWLVLGGLNPPEQVTEAVKEYKADSDPIGDFLDAEVSGQSGERVGASALYDAYVLWCGKNGQDPISKKGFGMSMAGRGHKKIKSNGNNYWLNLKLLVAVEPAGGGMG